MAGVRPTPHTHVLADLIANLTPPYPLNSARYVEQLETLKSQEKTITRNAQVVEQMYALLAQYDVKAPSEDMVQVDDLRTIKVHAAHTSNRLPWEGWEVTRLAPLLRVKRCRESIRR